jgi:glycosyltransferase involved in cell wall biosynthesis
MRKNEPPEVEEAAGKTIELGGTAPSGRVLFLSTYVPTQCGIATFSKDLADSVDRAAGEPVCAVMAIERGDPPMRSKGRVVHTIQNDAPGAYRQAARFANSHPCEGVSIQHEFGLYPGEQGEALLEFARACAKPIAVTLHTVTLTPPRKTLQVLHQLAGEAAKLVVMSKKGAQILRDVYGISPQKVAYVPHGTPEMKCDPKDWLEHRMNLPSGPLLLTWGLLSQGKGVEYVIQAMPRILDHWPRASYLVVGGTHPEVRKREGERYRHSLIALANRLGVRDHVCFDDRFISLDEVRLYLKCADVYVSTNLERQQITSGTLSYAVAAGKAIVSTPYLHAEEMAERGAALLAEFRRPNSVAGQVLRVLGDTALRTRLQNKARQVGRSTRWPNVGKRYHALFRAAAREAAEAAPQPAARPVPAPKQQWSWA